MYHINIDRKTPYHILMEMYKKMYFDKVEIIKEKGLGESNL